MSPAIKTPTVIHMPYSLPGRITRRQRNGESLLQRLMVAPGKGYNVFAGRDASKALGKSSMKAEDLSADYSELTEWELKVLDDWVAYYTKVHLRHYTYI